MSPERLGPDDPQFWLDYARTDLRIAQEGVKHGYRLEPLCFHAQQAAEKALKAVLISRQVSFPKIHELDRLIKRLPSDLAPPPKVKEAVSLSDYSESGRYPHGFDDLTIEDHRKAVEQARVVVEWAEKVVARTDETGIREKGAAYRINKKSMKNVHKTRTVPTAEKLALMADKGKDISKHFTNQGKKMSAIRRIKKVEKHKEIG